MNNKRYVIIVVLVFFTTIIYAQNTNTKLKGIVKYNSKALENINIINKTQKLGTASDANGAFEMVATKGDSIEFSSLEYQNRIIAVSDNHISTGFMTVFLEPGFNELDEVQILQKMRMDMSNVAVQRNAKLDIDDMEMQQAPDTRDISGYNTQLTNGMDLVAIYELLTKKKRAKKRSENDIKNEIEFIKQELPNTLRKEYGDDFFTDWLHIENDEINEFLDFCQGNGLGNYYKSEEIYIKDFLIKQSKLFNEAKNKN